MSDTAASAATAAVTPIEVAESAVRQQVKGQVRIALAAGAGALVGKHILPAGLVNDTLLNAVSAVAMMGIASVWQDVRVRLQHSRLWQLAIDPRVPDDLVRPVDATAHPASDPALVAPKENVMLKTVLVEIEDTALDALKAAGTVLEGFVISEGQKLVAEAKATALGTTAMNLVSALSGHSASGAEKMVMLIAALTPAVASLKASGGLSTLVGTVESFVKEFAQSVYNDFANVAATQVASIEAAVAPAPLARAA